MSKILGTRRKPPTPEERKECFERYQAGESAPEISKAMGLGRGAVTNSIKKLGGKMRRNCSLNHNAFDDLSNPDAAYWVGFLLADGCICDNRVRLGLAELDKQHVEDFREFLGSNHKITTRKAYKHRIKGRDVTTTSSHYFEVRSNQLVSALNALGFTERKTFTIKCPDQLKYNLHFWRGVIDGDGYISKPETQRNALELYGNEYICQAFHEYCESLGVKVTTKPKESIFRSYLSCKNAAIVAKELYCNDSQCLDRKKKNAIYLVERYINKD